MSSAARSSSHERSEEYKLGGLHPVKYMEEFNNGQYTVMAKLGQDTRYTLWLAKNNGKGVVDRDFKNKDNAEKQSKGKEAEGNDSDSKGLSNEPPEYVALKILSADESRISIEKLILLQLNTKKHWGINHINILLDHFVHEGPNGKHQCLVFKAPASTAGTFPDRMRLQKKSLQGIGFPTWFNLVRIVQVLSGLSALHDQNIVHGNIQANAVFFSQDDLSSEDFQSASLHHVYKHKNKVDIPIPAMTISLRNHVTTTTTIISGLESAFRGNAPPSRMMTPLAIRAPEIILHQNFGIHNDVWACGCLLFEYVTGKPLFAVTKANDDQEAQNDADDGHLIQMHDILGPLPEHMLKNWSREKAWREKLEKHSKSDVVGSSSHGRHDLETLVKKYGGDEVSERDAKEICAYLKNLLTYDPAKRVTTERFKEIPLASPSTT